MKRNPVEQLVILDRFTKTFEEDVVSGRSNGLADNLKARLQKFADGAMPDSECGYFIVEIVWNESAMGYLADLLGANP